MTKQTTWKAFGNYNKSIRPNLMSQVFAVLVAMATFQDPKDKYQWLMAVLVMLGSAWVGYWAWRGKSYIGLLTPLVALFFIDPLVNGPLFHEPIWFMLIQSASALLFGAAAYTFMRTGTAQSKGNS